MVKKRESGLVRQLKEAIAASGKSLYRISKDTGVSQPQLGRFMSGERGLSMDNLGKIFDALDLQIVGKQAESPPKPRKKK